MQPSASEKIEHTPSRALAIVARNDPDAAAFIEKFTKKHCKIHVSDEWEKVDDRKLDKLRGILDALKEENQATQLLKKESEDRQAGQALEGTRASVKKRLEECKAQEALFEEKQAELRRHVMENEKSLRLMETNIEKGEKKAKDEAVECKRLDTEIAAVLRDIKEHQDGKTFEQQQIARAKQHKAFLENVVLEEEDFEGDIKVLMNRYDRLDAEKQSLHLRNTQLEGQLNQVREELAKVQAELQTEQMMSSSRLHESQVALERHVAESNNLDQDLNRMLEEKELNKSKVGVILMAIEQIFTRAVQSCRLKQRREAMLSEVDGKDAKLESQLNQIIARVKDLRDMSDKVRKHLDSQKPVQVASTLDEGDLMDKVEIVTRRGDRPNMYEATSSSRQSSELALGALSGSTGGRQGSDGKPSKTGAAQAQAQSGRTPDPTVEEALKVLRGG